MDRHIPTDRRHFIGGSDIGAIVGVSRFKTPLDVYLEKTGQAEVAVDPQREKIFRRGKRLEPVVLDMLEEEIGIATIARNQRYVDGEFDFMACEVDAEAMVDAEHVNLEVKTSHPFAADQWGEEGTDEIDISYTAQAMWGLGITGRRRCIFAVLIGSDNLVTYEVVRDDETIAAMRLKAQQFWRDHVLAGVPPDPSHLPDVLKLFRKDLGTEVKASDEIAALVVELERAKQAASAAEDRQVELKYTIGKYMLGETGILLGNKGHLLPGPDTKPGKHRLTYEGREILTVNLQAQNRLDNDKVRRDYPEVATACNKSIQFFRFDRPRGKQRP